MNIEIVESTNGNPTCKKTSISLKGYIALYLDLAVKIQDSIEKRAEIKNTLIDYMDSNDFLETELHHIEKTEDGIIISLKDSGQCVELLGV